MSTLGSLQNEEGPHEIPDEHKSNLNVETSKKLSNSPFSSLTDQEVNKSFSKTAKRLARMTNGDLNMLEDSKEMVIRSKSKTNPNQNEEQ